MLPSEKFKRVIRVTRLCASICGADIIDKNYKMNAVTYFIWFCIMLWFLFSYQTVVAKFSEDWTIALETFCMVGTTLQGISKLASGIVHTRTFSKISYSLQSIYESYEQKGQVYIDALNKCISRLLSGLKYTGIFIILVLCSFVLPPIFLLLITGEHTYVLNFDVPFADPDTNTGYFITLGVQILFIIFGAFGNFAADMFLLMFFGHVSLFADIVRLKINELNELAGLLDNNTKIDDILSDIIDWHRTYLGVIEETDRIFFWITFTQVTTSALSSTLTLAIMFVGSLRNGYGYLVMCFSMLYLYCGMGTLVEIANNEFLDEIYAIHWYNLNIGQQKAVKLILMRAQMAKTINVGDVAPLSVSTGLQVTKTVYSVFMMLLNFIT